MPWKPVANLNAGHGNIRMFGNYLNFSNKAFQEGILTL